MDPLRDKVWRMLLDRGVQLKYEPVTPDAFPMPKREYLYPTVDVEIWEELLKSFVEALEVLKIQAVKEAENPKPPKSPWMRKNHESGLFEYDYPEDVLGK